MCSYLSFCEAEAVRELLPLRSHDVVVLFERVLEPEQLRRGERRADPLGLPGERVVQKEALRTRFVSCSQARNNDRMKYEALGYLYVTFISHHRHIRPPLLGFYIRLLQ